MINGRHRRPRQRQPNHRAPLYVPQVIVQMKSLLTHTSCKPSVRHHVRLDATGSLDSGGCKSKESSHLGKFISRA